MKRPGAVRDRTSIDPVLVGHPFAPMGIGEHLRCTLRALVAAGLKPKIWDIYGWEPKDPDLVAEFGSCVVNEFSRGANIFHINADEVKQAFEHMATEPPPDSYNIIYPNWELAKYPAPWTPHLERFDEVWALSEFNSTALKAATPLPVSHLPAPCDVRVSSLLGRRYFGISESAFVFLFVFDLTSYTERKNPRAILEAFKQFQSQQPYGDCCLVIKVGGMHREPAALEEFRKLCADHGSRVILIDRVLSDNEIKNLVRNSDCFISLHRAEGYGRLLIEAMFLSRPVIASAYSGNMDFMTPDNSCLVDCKLIPVGPQQYPHGDGQVWADPNLDQAIDWMRRLVNDRELGRRIGERASRHIRVHFSPRAAGLRMASRLRKIGHG